jgi:hypothetical protein
MHIEIILNLRFFDSHSFEHPYVTKRKMKMKENRTQGITTKAHRHCNQNTRSCAHRSDVEFFSVANAGLVAPIADPSPLSRSVRLHMHDPCSGTGRV